MHMHYFEETLHRLKDKTPKELKLKLTFNTANIMQIQSFEDLQALNERWYIRADEIHDRLIEAEEAAAMIPGGYTERKVKLIQKEYSHVLNTLRDFTEYAIAHSLMGTEGFNVQVD